MLGLLHPLSGTVTRAPGLVVGYVPQRGNHDSIFPLTALDVVRAGGAAHAAKPHRPFSLLAAPSEARLALDSMGIGHLADHPFARLSGGQAQRVLLARALVRKPDLLALDEPTAGMDLPSERDLLDHVQRLSAEKGMAVLLVTHQLCLAGRARRIALLDKDRDAFVMGDADNLMTATSLSSAFGREMAVVVAAGSRIVLAGKAPETAP